MRLAQARDPRISYYCPFINCGRVSALYGNYLASLLVVVMLFITDLNTWPAIGLTALSLAFLQSLLILFINSQLTQCPIISNRFIFDTFLFGKTGARMQKSLSP